MFSVNDTIIYGTNGICTISDITTRTFGKDAIEYYVLTPVGERASVIYVPTANRQLTDKMRRILSADEVNALIDTIGREPADEWITDDQRRHAEFRQTLQSGDRARLIRMIKAIYLHGKEQKAAGRKLHHADDVMMKDAENLLYEEFSTVLTIPRDEILPYIINKIEH